MNSLDQQYINLLKDILANGEDAMDRTQVGTKSVFGRQMDIDISQAFPLLTIKKTHYTNILDELLWFLSGSTDVGKLHSKIWDGNSTPEFLATRGLIYPPKYIGPSYGYQMRGNTGIDEFSWDNINKEYSVDPLFACRGIDQIQNMIDTIIKDPKCRRNILNNWDVENVQYMALPPCHALFQVNVRNGQFLDGQLYQRSADVFLGVPYNIASYATLIYILANITGLKPGRLIMTFGDVHIYNNHIEQCNKLLDAKIYDSPTLEITEKLDINNLQMSQFNILNYQSGKYLYGKMAI